MAYFGILRIFNDMTEINNQIENHEIIGALTHANEFNKKLRSYEIYDGEEFAVNYYQDTLSRIYEEGSWCDYIVALAYDHFLQFYSND